MSRQKRAALWGMGVLLGFSSGALSAAALSRHAREKLAQEAESFYKEGNYGAAREKWSAALRGGATRAETRRWRPELGRTYEAEGNYQKALAAYQEAFDIDANNVDRLVDLARLYDAVEIDDQAIRFYADAHERNRSRRDVSLALARLYKEAGRLVEARVLAESAVHAEPRDYSAQKLMAEIEEAQGALADAAKRRETVLAQHPTGAGYMTLGRLWAKQGAFEQADVAFVRAVGEGVGGAEPIFERAVLAWRQGDPARARRFLDELTGLDPDFFPAGFLKIVLDVDAHDEKGARRQLGRLNAPDPGTQQWKDVLETAMSARAAGGKP